MVKGRKVFEMIIDPLWMREMDPNMHHSKEKGTGL